MKRLMVLIACSTLCTPIVLAETYIVRPDGSSDFPTIQAALQVAATGDVIELTDGTFTGEGFIDRNFQGGSC